MSSTMTEVVGVISEWIEVPPERVMQAQSLADLEIDSLGLIDIIFELERRLSIDIPDKLLSGVTSLADVARVVDQVRMGSSDLQAANA